MIYPACLAKAEGPIHELDFPSGASSEDKRALPWPRNHHAGLMAAELVGTPAMRSDGSWGETRGQNMRLISVAAVLGLTVFVIDPARSDEAMLPQLLQTVVDDYLGTRHDIEKISGVALHVDLVNHGPIYVYSGTNGRGHDPAPIDDTTLFQIGSNTKHFTSALILKLEAEGKLNIDQTIGDWLAQYPAWAHVTIRRLLNMTADIPNYSEAVSIAQEMSADIHRQFSQEELVAAVYDKGLPIPSGYFYSNTNDVLAGLIIEKAAQMSYEDALDTMLLEPLHLKDTFYKDAAYSTPVLRRLPVGIYDNTDCTIYQPKPCALTAWAPLVGKDVSHQNLSWAGPAGGMISNTGDLAQWIRALFGGRVIPPQQLAEMTSIVSTKTGQPIPDVSADDPFGFGLDLGRAYRAELGGGYWFYQGTTFGFRAIFAYWPQYDLVITAATNSQPQDNEDQLGAVVVGGAFLTLQKQGLIP
jgi:D-alanyl-D-alanine carboxypeptidase